MRHDSETLMLPAVNLLMDERRLISFLGEQVTGRQMRRAPERTAVPSVVAHVIASALAACAAESGGHVCLGEQVIHLRCPDATDRDRAALARRAAWWRRRADRAIERHVAAWARREKRERRRLVREALHMR